MKQKITVRQQLTVAAVFAFGFLCHAATVVFYRQNSPSLTYGVLMLTSVGSLLTIVLFLIVLLPKDS